MNKAIKITMLVIGTLTVLAGMYRYFYKSETNWDTYWGIFIGVAIIGSMLFTKPKKENKENK